LSSLFLFYYVLLTHPEDELRLITFFLASLITYVLLGKTYGLILSLVIMISIFIIISSKDLKLSTAALSTFFSFFTIFTGSLYAFINKVEKDEVEFEKLNKQLANSVVEEKHQRAEQEQMLLRQYRMAHMGEMLDAIAHQWRQPLMHINSIIMNIDYALEKKANKDNYLAEKVNEVALLTAHMSQTINDFRNLFNQENEQTQFKLVSVVNNVLELMKNRFIDVKVNNKSSKDVTICGYQSELTQVIIILLSNAIEVLNSRQIKNKKITLDTKTNDEQVIITIEDNAGGVKLNKINTIFSPYVTSKKQDGGTGLGLYIAKIIIENKMKGKLTVINTLQGAKFTIVLLRNS
jgi:C4-dicarboxylate-specific signal transduction histidine kinase